MADLISLAPCGGLLPLTVGTVALREVTIEAMCSVAPFNGQDKTVSAQLAAQVGAPLSDINRRTGPVTWFGHGVWMVSRAVTLDDCAAVTDQSDGWAVIELAGQGTEDVLVRLIPVDLRANVFKVNHVAKTMLGHLSVTITRTGADAFEIMVMRSMAATLVHDLQGAMRGVAAR